MKLSLALISVVLIIGGFLAWNHSESICKYRDGKWASTKSQCITRSCYASNSCGTWAAPGFRCNKLKIGNDISEVYFQLGNPESITNSTYYWYVGKTDTAKIKAIIKNNKLTSIKCNET